MSLSMKEAIYTRHTVRQYKKKAIPQAILDKLSKRIEQVNQTYNTKITPMMTPCVNTSPRAARSIVPNFFTTQLAINGVRNAGMMEIAPYMA